MSIKYFHNVRALFMFDPETYKSYVYETGKWVESNDLACLDEIRFHTAELSISEAIGMLSQPREEPKRQVN